MPNPTASATELLEKLEIKDMCPLPLQKIVDHLGYKAQLFAPSEKTRKLAGGVNQETKVIFANSSDAAHDQRYAFAHEIGHILLHPGENIVDKRQNMHFTNEEPKEFDANQFADELLMESNLFLRKWDEVNGDTGKMAHQFGLSKERVTARARFLGIM